MRRERWIPGPARPAVSADAVDVWRVHLDRPAAEECLAADEVDRAERFRFERHRRRFVAARAALRAVLGRHLSLDAGEIVFGYGEHGKPYLAGGGDIEFNLAHSGELALIAVAHRQAVGIDVEEERDKVSDEGIAERFFSSREVAALQSLPEARRRAAFFRCWTRKEAFLKATGKGLSFGLGQFSVSLLPGKPARLLDVPESAGGPSAWSMFHLEPGEGYQGALVVEGLVEKVHLWQFD